MRAKLNSALWCVFYVLLTAVLVLSGCGQEPAPASPGNSAPVMDSLAPDFTLKDLDGNTVRLSDFRGKVVFLNFWATWCGPCRMEMADIEEVHQEYRNRGVVVLGVDLRESAGMVRSFVQQGGYTWTFLLDTSGQVGTAYRVRGIPSSFFIDREGVIRAVAVGAIPGETMEQYLAQAMQ